MDDMDCDEVGKLLDIVGRDVELEARNAMKELEKDKAGVYIVPYNLIFFPFSNFLIWIFPLKIISVTSSSQQCREDACHFPFFHVIFLPTADIFPSLFTT